MRYITQNLGIVHFAVGANYAITLLVLGDVEPLATALMTIIMNVINSARPAYVFQL